MVKSNYYEIIFINRFNIMYCQTVQAILCIAAQLHQDLLQVLAKVAHPHLQVI